MLTLLEDSSTQSTLQLHCGTVKHFQIPVIFHDFYVLISVARRSTTNLDAISKDGGNDFHELAVKELNLKQLQLLRVFLNNC